MFIATLLRQGARKQQHKYSSCMDTNGLKTFFLLLFYHQTLYWRLSVRVYCWQIWVDLYGCLGSVFVPFSGRSSKVGLFEDHIICIDISNRKSHSFLRNLYLSKIVRFLCCWYPKNTSGSSFSCAITEKFRLLKKLLIKSPYSFLSIGFQPFESVRKVLS